MNHPGLEELARMFSHAGRNRKPLDRFTVPPQHIRPLYEKIDALNAAKKEGRGYTVASRDLWAFVSKIIPATAFKDATVNTNDIMRPTIDVFSDKTHIPSVGVDEVVAVYVIPTEHIFRFIEMCEAEEGSAVAKYDLWRFVNDILPLKHETEDGKRIVNSIRILPEWTGVVGKVEDE